MANDATHLTHCNFGENLGSCKYGEDEICPALKPNSLASQAATLLRAKWRNAVAAGRTEAGFHEWAEYRQDDSALMNQIYAELEKNDGR